MDHKSCISGNILQSQTSQLLTSSILQNQSDRCGYNTTELTRSTKSIFLTEAVGSICVKPTASICALNFVIVTIPHYRYSTLHPHKCNRLFHLNSGELVYLILKCTKIALDKRSQYDMTKVIMLFPKGRDQHRNSKD